MNIDEEKNNTCHICALTKLTMILANETFSIILVIIILENVMG